MPDKIIIFALPGLGSHHLANMISLCGRYNYPVDYTKYFTSYLSNAHYDFQSKDPLDIFLYHFGSADDREIKNICQHSEKRFIVIHFPQKNQLAWSRIQNTNNLDFTKNHLRYDLEKIYKQNFLSKIYPGNWQTVMADDLFSNNIDKIIQSLGSTVEFDQSQHQFLSEIHSAWLAKITKNPNPFSMKTLS